ncbi:conserved unknown protein [Ectocarpus siliculosus]|uniref:Uncharacterized protein n=1 Tax=Ectocarpus siliculosus TaxID=2880 RepID=D8LM03_ECTSI|nr:conserved unknown protein [Ectocarpus siliculosus]|eukprot:CBN77217.1 conserved unknown protein [Ectocarpus siliculosus]
MDQPSWMQNTGQAAAPPGTSSGGAPAQQNAGSRSGDATVVRSVFHFVNIGVAVMMAASAAFGLIDFRNFENVVLSVYLMIFAVLLFMYEFVRVMGNCERPKQIMTKNFGFFFGAKGRGLYLVFVGFLNFPLDLTLSFWTGVVTLGWGVLTVLAYMTRPEWFEVPKPAQNTSV